MSTGALSNLHRWQIVEELVLVVRCDVRRRRGRRGRGGRDEHFDLEVVVRARDLVRDLCHHRGRGRL